MFEPREPAETIKFVDDCEWYRNLFPEVRVLRRLNIFTLE